MSDDVEKSNVAGNGINITSKYNYPEPPPNDTPPAWLRIITVIKQQRKKILAVLILLIFSLIGWHKFFSQYAAQLEEAQTYMNMGLYPQAQTAYQQAVKQHPFNHFLDIGTADWGLEKTRVFDSKDKIAIEKKLRQFEKQHPNDADVQVLFGRFFLTFRQLNEAEKHYEHALEINPNIAEAYSGLCEIYDLKNPARALKACENALKFSVGKPDNYSINLAGQYAQNGKYQEALQLLGTLEEKSLLAKFERAKLFQITQQLPKAEKLQEQVLQALSDTAVTTQPQNRENWYFKSTLNMITLTDSEQKKCYVNYSLAASFYLQNNLGKAQEHLQKATELCGENNAEIIQQLLFDLSQAQKNGASAKLIEEFIKALPVSA